MSSPAQSYLQVITNDNFIRDVLRKLFGIEGAGLVLAHLITPQPPPKKKKKVTERRHLSKPVQKFLSHHKELGF